jgi:HEAT repeat protein
LKPNRQRQVLLGTLVAAAAATAWLGLVGWPILREEWLLRRLEARSFLEREAACAALGRVGTARSVPALLDRLVKEETTGPPWERRCSLDVIPFYRTGAAIYWDALREMGEPAIPHLVKALASKDAAVKPWAADLLGEIGAGMVGAIVDESGKYEEYYVGTYLLEPVPPSMITTTSALIRELGAEDEALAHEVMESLQSMGSVVVPALIRVVEEETGKAREAAAIALLSMGRLDPRAVAALTRLQDHLSPAARQAAIGARCRAFQEARDAALESGESASLKAERQAIEHALAAELESSDAGWRALVLSVLENLEDYQPETTRRVATALKDPVPAVRAAAAGALRGKKAAAAAWNTLVEALRDPEEDVREAAAGAVASLGENMPEAWPALVPLLGDEATRDTAVVVLAEAGARGVPALIEALGDRNRDICRGAAEAFARMVSLTEKDDCGGARAQGEAVLAALERSLEIPQAEVRQAVAEALGVVFHCLRNEYSRIGTLLAGADPHERLGAARALAVCGRWEPRLSVPLLLSALQDADPGVRAAAARALGFVGGTRGDSMLEQIVPALITALGDKRSAKVITRAAEALERLAAPAAAAVPVLDRLLRESKSATVRLSALKALASIHWKETESLSPVLVRGLHDGDRAIQEEAVRLIESNPKQSGFRPAVLLAALDVAGEEKVERLLEPLLKGKQGRAAIPVVMGRLRTGPGAELAGTLTRALASIGGSDATVVPALLDALREDTLRLHVIRASKRSARALARPRPSCDASRRAATRRLRRRRRGP